ncbi:hypothetical protein D3C72_1285520 [compost metagenome]
MAGRQAHSWTVEARATVTAANGTNQLNHTRLIARIPTLTHNQKQIAFALRFFEGFLTPFQTEKSSNID